MSDQKVTDTMRLLASAEVLGAPRATECNTLETFVRAHFAENPNDAPGDIVAAVKILRRNPLAGGMCQSVGTLKDLIKQLQELFQRFQEFCPTPPSVPTGNQVSCGGMLAKILASFCPTIAPCCGEGGEGCCPQPKPGPDDGQKNG